LGCRTSIIEIGRRTIMNDSSLDNPRSEGMWAKIQSQGGFSQCLACGSAAYPGERFCSCCGEPLQNRCPACGTGLRHPIANYCGNCGRMLEGSFGKIAGVDDAADGRE
jgi:hypothetical protein